MGTQLQQSITENAKSIAFKTHTRLKDVINSEKLTESHSQYPYREQLFILL